MLCIFPLPWCVLVVATNDSPSCLIEILRMHSLPGAPLRGSSIVTLTLLAILGP